jgi:O-Antigen ligase
MMALMAARPLVDPRMSTTEHERIVKRRAALLIAGVALATLVGAALVLALQVVSAVVVLTWIVLGAIAWRPIVGLYVAFGLVLFFEGGGADQMMLPGWYFQNGLSATLGLPVISSPLELLLLLTFAFWLARLVCSRQRDFRPGLLFWPVILFTMALVAGLIYGLATGGDVNVALWESRFLFYVFMCYIVAVNTIRKPVHIQHLISLGMIGTIFFAVEGAYRRFALIDTGKIGVIPEFAYSHESVIFLGTLIPLVIAQQIYGAPRWQRVLGIIALPIVIFTLLATERRAAYIALFVAFVAFGFVVFATHRKAFFLLVVPLLLGMVIYVPIFWNNTGLAGQPARAVRSLYQPDPRDAGSNLYRDLEKINVLATIQSSPLLGVGFGKPFLMVAPLPDLSWWPFWRYEPHHNILWVWLKVGAIGFVLFWLLIGSAIAGSAHLAKTIRDPTVRTMAVFALTGIIATLVFCYVDLGLVSSRVTVFLGTTIGAISVMGRLKWQET